MSPPDVERVPGWIRVHLVALGRIEVGSGLEQPSAKPHGLFVCRPEILHVQIKVHLLLGVSVRPIGRDVIGSQLNANSPRSVGVDNTVEGVVFEDVTTQHAGPELAFGRQISGVENNDLAHHSHGWTVLKPAEPTMPERPTR